MAEPEWDDHYRELVEGLAEHDRSCCSGCGIHPSMVDKPLQIEESYCPVCKAQASYGRKVADRDEKHREKHKSAPPGDALPNDGLHVHLRSLSLQEAAERKTMRRADG